MLTKTPGINFCAFLTGFFSYSDYTRTLIERVNTRCENIYSCEKTARFVTKIFCGLFLIFQNRALNILAPTLAHTWLVKSELQNLARNLCFSFSFKKIFGIMCFPLEKNSKFNFRVPLKTKYAQKQQPLPAQL